MQNIGFIPNIDRDQNLETTKALVRFAVANGHKAYIDDALYPLLANTGATAAEGDLGKCADFFVVLGGDGTILHAAQYAAMHDKPLIGFNLGNLGYLTDVEGTEAEVALGQVLAGHYNTEKRMMLEVSIEGSVTEAPMLALNDVCITRGARSKMIGCRVFVNDDYIDTYHADGLIVCTPTGSTAYNLSAGGPILKPELEAIAITPICPHTLYARASVISAEDVITIQTLANAPEDVTLSLDGHNTRPIGKNATIRVTRSAQYTTILKTNQLGFYDILRTKMLGK